MDMIQQMKHLKTSLESANDGNKDNKQQPQMYAKNSMDRFGDDLCALIVSYLSLEDRFRCECVSKQFQRTVFGSVVDITLNEKTLYKKLNYQILTRIAIKCPNIRSIEMKALKSKYSVESLKVLDIFRDNCRHLRQIYYNFRKIIGEFESLITGINSANENQSLDRCLQLSRLRVNSLSDVFHISSADVSQQLLAKNLHKFSFNYKSSDNNVLLSAFVAHNQSLKSLVIVMSDENHETLTEMCGQLSRLTQLRELNFNITIMNGENSLSDSLRTIGLNCKQLQRLTLGLMTSCEQISDQILISLAFFSRLKRLDLTLFAAIDHKSLEPLKLCHRLTHLTLYLHSNDINFEQISAKYLPRIQYLSIISPNLLIKNKALKAISKLLTLKSLLIMSSSNSSSGSGALSASIRFASSFFCHSAVMTTSGGANSGSATNSRFGSPISFRANHRNGFSKL
ncbi:unnamed protein product [Medioppia subpectinata]|uniref:F-box domain-containing protein n=1 Tax=Medioppia subpectinata TaxID=1979941 RepID=A0A7R9KQS7_9ACAR|nr:unnamed protein product [Medioppia subpectinata]CAG2108098.1 unnamed protein product [Medioppia subpectinata]